MANLPAGTITFLFSDVEGASEKPQASREIIQAAIARYEALFRQAVEASGGYVYKRVGNGFQVAFPSAQQAIAAAYGAQLALSTEPLPPEVPVGVRMALHTGLTEQREGNYAGPLLNRVARLLAAAHPGQVLLTEASAELAKESLPPGITLHDLGEHRLRDLVRPEHVYQLVGEGLPLEFPPLKTLEAGPNNLPLQPTPLIGREREVAECCGLLRQSDVWLLTLTGPAGTGKTRLGLQVAAELLDDFPDGAFLVSLASISDPSLVAPTIAQNLGVREMGGQPVIEMLKAYLRDKQMLLVLDNFEQVVDASPSIAEVLEDCPQLKALATSRTPLHLSIERDYPVPPLSLPHPGHLPSLDALSGYESVALFVARARAANPAFQMTEQNAIAVAEICYRLDGLPLAIELAAARSRILAPEAILARLGSRLTLLTGGLRDLPARQQTLRSTIDWSYNLLEPGEQELFARLAVFVGGSTLEAAEAVTARPAAGRKVEGAMSSIDVLDGLGSLVDKNLVRQQEVGEEIRFDMLQTIREYALERLEASGEEAAVRKAHAEYYLALAEQARPELTGPNQPVWLAKLEREHDNLRAVLEWALERQDPELEGRLAGALVRFWHRHGHLMEARRWLTSALAHTASLSSSIRVELLHGLGLVLYEQGDHIQAKELNEEALVLRKELGDKKAIITTLNNLANVALFEDDYKLAEQLYGEALALARELDDRWSIAATLGNVGWVQMGRADYERAAVFYEEALAIRRELTDKWGIANSLDHLAWARTYQGNYKQAIILTEQAMQLFEELGDKDSISDLLDIHGRCALGLGEYEQARDLMQKSLALSQELGDKSGIALALLGLAALAGAQGQSERAATLFGVADALSEFTAPFQRVYFERHEAEAHAQINEADFQRAREQGKSMTPDQAISYALGKS